MVSVLILTKNEEQDLPACLQSVAWCDDIQLFDSYSDDLTLEIAHKFGAIITQRKFDNWSSHQNWGLANINFKYDWVFYIDADERVSDSLKEAILEFDPITSHVAFEIQRRDFAWNGKRLKYAQMSPYYLRLFKPNQMRYERLVNPVSIPSGTVSRLSGFLDHYPFSKGLKFWWQRHLGYADMEAITRVQDIGKGLKFSFWTALFGKDFTEKRYHQKGLFYKLPGRPLIKFIYMMIWRRAFLDGSVGITYSFLQSIYEYFIVLKTKELMYQKSREITS